MMDKEFRGIDDRIFNDPIYKEDEISEHDHPSVKDKNE